MSEPVQQIALGKLRESPDNPRKLFGDMADFAASIKTQGILQPVVARKVADGLELVFGHRRFRAAKLAGLKELPVIVREMTRQQAIEAMLVENQQRADVNPLELARGLQTLMNDFGLTADEAGDRVGIARSTVYSITRLLDLAEPAQKAILAGRISPDAGKEIAKVRGERLQLAALNDALKLGKKGEPPPVRAVQRMIRDRYLSTRVATRGKKASAKDENAAAVAIRRRVITRLLGRVSELIERKPHLDDLDMRTAIVAIAETGGEPVRHVFQRRGVRPDRLSKVGASQLRSLLVELALAPWVSLDENGEFAPSVKVTAKAYEQSLADLSANVENEGAAEALFQK